MSLIELKNISKTYHMGAIEVPVLHDISLSIDEGEFVVIMGHSGSGKSTLLHILGLLDTPSGGSYLLAGEDTARLPDDRRAALRNKYIGYIFQQFNLLPRMTALENVGLPLVYADRKSRTAVTREKELLTTVGLGERMNHKPGELSGGQQQRVAIARSLVNDPLIIFADEPTGNLDSKSSAEIIGILKELNARGITIVMVTHEPEFAAIASRVIRIHDGGVLADERVRKPARSTTGTRQNGSSHPLFDLDRVKDYFIQALRSLVSNKTRAALSILGVLIGVASLIAMLALGNGASEQVKKNISSLGSNILSVRASNPFHGGVSLESGAAIQLTLMDADQIRERVGGITYVAPYVTGRGQVIYNGKNWNTRIEGTSPDYPALRNAYPSAGRFFTQDETTSRARVVLIGKTVKDNLFGDEDPIGKFIRIKRTDFQVIGILPIKGSNGFRDEDDKITVPVNTAMYRLLGKDTVENMDVQVKNADDMDAVSEKIKTLLAALHRLPESKKDSLDVRNMADIQETITATTRTFSMLLGSIAFVSLLVGGIGIMNIMLVSVSERTREIGLRKAIGANNKDILFQFVIEAVTVCVLGGVLGIVLGSGISLAFAKFAGWSTKVAPFSVGLSFIFSVLIGLVFGVWPARKASQLHPIDALRYE